MLQSSTKKKQTHHKNDNVLEALGSVPTSVGSNTVAEFSKIGSDIVSSVIGGMPKSGELQPNQAIEFGGPAPEQVTPQPIRVEAQHRPNKRHRMDSPAARDDPRRLKSLGIAQKSEQEYKTL